jgi:PAS domain S-box-containing protein
MRSLLQSGSTLHRYGIAVLVTGLALLLRWPLLPVLGLKMPYLTVYPAVIILAVRFGMRPAVLSALLGFGFAELYLIAPIGAVVPTTSLGIRAAIVLLSAWYMGHVGDRLRTSLGRAEAEAAASRLLSSAVDAAANGIAVTDREGRLLWVNAAFARLTGYSPAEMVGQNPRVLKSGRHPPGFYREMWATVLRGEVWQGELVNKRKDGSLYTEEMTITPIRAADGAITHFVAVKQDISERRAAEHALRQSEQRLKRAQEIANLGSWELDLENQRLTWSDEVFRIFGLQPHEFGSSYEAFLEAVHPDDRAAVNAAYVDSLRENRDEYEIEHRIVRASTGEVRIVHEKCEHFRDDSGRIIKSAGMVHDITERKRAEEAVRSQNHRLLMLHETAEELLAAADPATVIHRLRDRLSKHLQADEILLLRSGSGHSRLTFDCSPDVSAEAGALAKSLEKEAVDSRFIREFGAGCYIYYPLKIEARLLGGLVFVNRRGSFDGVAQDFLQTIARNLALALERVRLDDELRRHASELERRVDERTAKLREMVSELEHFSYTITHDMRAPLRAMQGFGQLMLDEDCAGCVHPQSRDYLRRIVSASHRMDQLINDALSYSRIVRGELDLGAVDPTRLVREILDTYPQFQPPKAEIRLDGELPPVIGSEAMMTQVLSNLLGNAVKFVAPGVVPRVHISAEAGDGIVRISVADNGLGIAPEMQARIFDMFCRLSRDYDGTGIGLAIVRKAVERMHGRVGVESARGRGSRFWVELPRAGTGSPAGPGPTCDDSTGQCAGGPEIATH